MARFLAGMLLAFSPLATAWAQVEPSLDAATTTEAGEPSDAPSEEQLVEARELFAQGLERVEQQDWAAAEAMFRRVLAVKSSPVVAYNLASALAQLGRFVEAAELLRGVLRGGEADDLTRAAAEQLQRQIEPQIGSLTIRLVGDRSEVELLLDEHSLDAAPEIRTVSVDPGAHRVVARRGGQELAATDVEVGGDASLRGEVRLNLPQSLDLSVKSSQSGQSAAARSGSGGHDGVDDDASVATSPWLWLGAGVLVAGGVVLGILLGGQNAEPLRGDTDPPVVRGRVLALEMP
ncbi:MAG: hypothetical protein OEZ06_03050 [Myxococcales bacterium]|nr:hypothetical protein [Myxococcales bacterium]